MLSTAVDNLKTSPKSSFKKAQEHKYQHEIKLIIVLLPQAHTQDDSANLNQKKISNLGPVIRMKNAQRNSEGIVIVLFKFLCKKKRKQKFLHQHFVILTRA
jgi:hypothetical protein